MATPLRGSSADNRPWNGIPGVGTDREPTSNESLFLSALLCSESFNPKAFGIDESHFIAWRDVYAFAAEYQRVAGTPPPPELLAAHIPGFQIIDRKIDARWLADQLHKEASSRDLRLRGQRMAMALSEDDLAGAFEALEGVARPREFVAPPKSVFDHSSMEEVIGTTKIPTPWPTVNISLNGGLDITEMLLIQLRLGQGKSWLALAIAAKAARLGYRCAVASLEMPNRQVTLRSLQLFAGRDQRLQEQLISKNVIEAKKAVDKIAETITGDIKIYDPSQYAVNTIPTITSLLDEYDLVVVDHLGLMRGPDGRRAIEDWRVQATVSNMLREINLAKQTPIVAAVQANRAGEHAGTMSVPKPSEMAGSDALGQDATAILAGKRLSKRVMKCATTKARDGEERKLYLRFEPGRGRLDEMSQADALEMSADDDAFGDEN